MTSAEVERWFKRTKPPSEDAMRRVRDIILRADRSMRDRIQYRITFSSTKSGDFGAHAHRRRKKEASARASELANLWLASVALLMCGLLAWLTFPIQLLFAVIRDFQPPIDKG